ncbi:MAG TPA: hypothetical protein VLS27_13615, partial [Gammaproteobacteria bacterium]|nr:hypothetical protein [Gammaproteobacteria bacterium]
YGFPLAPMILGVVLGDNAEVNLIRALASDDNLWLFVTRPWSLFFLTIACFSVLFPWYQKVRTTQKWTLIFTPAIPLTLSVPMFMMGGWVRPGIAVVLLVVAAMMLWRRHGNGWMLPTEVSPELHES